MENVALSAGVVDASIAADAAVAAKASPRRGRPKGSIKFGVGDTRAFKALVRKHGLLAAHKILNEQGYTVFGKQVQISISLPTLSKYVKSNLGGNPVELHRGRPKSKAA